MKHPLTLAAIALFALALAGPVRAMDVDDVVVLLQNGVGEQVILAQVAAEGARFALTTDNILDLRKAGSSDDLIRQLILTGGDRGSSEAPGSTESRPDDWTTGYYAPSAQAQLYYYPFGYNWYAWPYSFSYYYPFSWWNAGFYYAGWWNMGWYAGYPCHDYYWDHYHYDHYASDGYGRHAWGRGSQGSQGYQASQGGRVAFDRASAVGRARLAPGQGAVSGSRTIYGSRTLSAPRAGDRRTYRRGYAAPQDRSGWTRPPGAQGPARNGGYSPQPSRSSGPSRGQAAPSGGSSASHGRSGGWRR